MFRQRTIISPNQCKNGMHGCLKKMQRHSGFIKKTLIDFLPIIALNNRLSEIMKDEKYLSYFKMPMMRQPTKAFLVV
jgi:hypothetical protein